MVETGLVHYDTARRELELASSIDEVKVIRDQAEAIRQYIRQQKGSLEMQNQAAEIKLRAERRAGEMLKLSNIKPGNPQLSHDVIIIPKLDELGITAMQSHRWQWEASVPEIEFEKYLIETKAKDDELTSIGLLRLASYLKRTEYQNDAIAIPTDNYRTIIIDPPWPIEKIKRDIQMHTPAQVQMDYPTLNIDQIKDLPIPCDNNCHLYLWTTQKYLPISFDIVEQWGFKYILTFVWHKNGGFHPFNLPQYNCEFIVFGRKGNIDFSDTKNLFTCFSANRIGHSRKPSEFYDFVARISPEPRIDMFSREKHKGFDQWGNETDKF